MEKPIFNFLSAIAAAIIVGACIAAPFYFSYKEYKGKLIETEQRLDSLEAVITNMQQVDTLVLNMSEYNAKSIEVMEENHVLMSTRLNATEHEIREINKDLDAFD